MRTLIWILVMLVAATAAGALAFRYASPPPSARDAGEPISAYSIDVAGLRASLANAAAYHRTRDHAAVSRRRAAVAARTWLEGLAGSRLRPGPVVRGVLAAGGTAEARGRIARFVRWADDLPPERWAVSLTATDPTAGATDGFTIRAFVDVTVAQAGTAERRQRVPVVVRVAGVGGASGAAPSQWRIRDITVGGRATFLRAYADPIVVQRGAIDVIAPRDERELATRTAELARGTLNELRGRYPNLGAPAAVSFWVAESSAAAATMIGAKPPASATATDLAAPHAWSWASDRGDVVIDLSRAAARPRTEQSLGVRRELALLVTRAPEGSSPPIIREGLAGAEVRRLQRSLGVPSQSTASAVELTQLLTAPTGAAPLLTTADYDASADLMEWIEREHGLARVAQLLAAVRRGVSLNRAVETILRTDRSSLVRAVYAPVTPASSTSPALEADDVNGN